MSHPIPVVVQTLANGDFTDIADRFCNAGFLVQLPARGILHITSSSSSSTHLNLLVSVGVHGDETGPIEILAHLLDEIAAAPGELGVNLMIVVGNLDAIASGKRYVDADMNRLFCAERADLASAAEAVRADAIMRATNAFFSAATGNKWHLDLHTAIRASTYPTFAIVPDVIEEGSKQALIAWLGGAGVGAVILNSKLAPTYSAYTAVQFGATSCTAEIGQVGTLGENDLDAFSMTRDALHILLRSGVTSTVPVTMPDVFEVAQELVKHSDDFSMSFDRTTQNFTSMEPGTVIAQDGDLSYTVGDATEYVVFPNPAVRIGQRAGLMVVQRVRA